MTNLCCQFYYSNFRVSGAPHTASRLFSKRRAQLINKLNFIYKKYWKNEMFIFSQWMLEFKIENKTLHKFCMLFYSNRIQSIPLGEILFKQQGKQLSVDLNSIEKLREMALWNGNITINFFLSLRRLHSFGMYRFGRFSSMLFILC